MSSDTFAPSAERVAESVTGPANTVGWTLWMNFRNQPCSAPGSRRTCSDRRPATLNGELGLKSSYLVPLTCWKDSGTMKATSAFTCTPSS